MSVHRADRNLSKLHPAIRQTAKEIENELQGDGIPFRIFEAFRSPQRQNFLYQKGRTTPGPIVTYARPWRSFHQFGLAVDFVLYEDGGWSWNTGGHRRAWWDRLHEVGIDRGLTPLRFEKPHLQIDDVLISDLIDGDYPDDGDDDWSSNLEEAISSWSGTPSSPPLPRESIDRPGLEISDPSIDWGALPTMSRSDWHSMHGGRQWRFDATGLYLREQPNAPQRTPGAPITCLDIIRLCGKQIAAASAKYRVAPELIVMTIATEAAAYRRDRFTGPRTFRWESQVSVTDVEPPDRGDYSAGPMQTLATTARWVIRVQNLDYDQFEVAPHYRTRPRPNPSNHPLYDYDNNIDIGTSEILQRWNRTGDDPILVAAAFNSGGLYRSNRNVWHLRSHRDHLDRAMRWYGDACAVLADLRGSRANAHSNRPSELGALEEPGDLEDPGPIEDLD